MLTLVKKPMGYQSTARLNSPDQDTFIGKIRFNSLEPSICDEMYTKTETSKVRFKFNSQASDYENVRNLIQNY